MQTAGVKQQQQRRFYKFNVEPRLKPNTPRDTGLTTFNYHARLHERKGKITIAVEINTGKFLLSD